MELSGKLYKNISHHGEYHTFEHRTHLFAGYFFLSVGGICDGEWLFIVHLLISGILVTSSDFMWKIIIIN